MTDPRVLRADKIEAILSQYDVPEEAKQRILAETGELKRPTRHELRPPNIPDNPDSLRESLENSSQERHRQEAKGIPPGWPGVDYHDVPETGVPHDVTSGPRTSQGVPVPAFIDRQTTA